MRDINSESVEKLLSILVLLALFVTRFDVTKGSLIYGTMLYLCGSLVFLYHKQIRPVEAEIKGYIKPLIIYFICIIPSILFSDKPFISFLLFFFALFQYGGFAIIILFIRRRKCLVNMLTAFFVFSAFDCLLTFIQPLFGWGLHNRGYGFGFNGRFLSIADIMCMLLPLVLVILMDPRFETKLKNSAAFAIFGVVLGLLGNKSRGAWLTELIVVPIAIFKYVMHNKKYLVSVTLVVFCVIGYMFSKPQYVQRIQSITNTTTDHSNADRIWAWKSAMLMIRDYPVTGVGFGCFSEIYEKTYKYEEETQNLPHTHNNFIQIAVESGVIGAAGFLYLVWYVLSTTFKNYREKPNPYDLILFTIFLAHVCVFGQIDYTFWGVGMQSFFLFLFAVVLRLKQTDTDFISFI